MFHCEYWIHTLTFWLIPLKFWLGNMVFASSWILHAWPWWQFFFKKRRLFKGNRGRDLHYDIIVIGRSNFAAPILIVLKQLEAMVTSKSAAKVWSHKKNDLKNNFWYFKKQWFVLKYPPFKAPNCCHWDWHSSADMHSTSAFSSESTAKDSQAPIHKPGGLISS